MHLTRKSFLESAFLIASCAFAGVVLVSCASGPSTPPLSLDANPGGPYSGNVGQTITFDGSKSTVPGGQTLSYAWNFGDNSTGTGVSPTHTYSTAGTFTVSLTVTGWIPGAVAVPSRGTNTATTMAAIVALPVASAGGPYSGNVGQTITFDGSKSTAPSGQTLTYAWNFGDNATGTGVSPTHAYSSAGTFTVSLTVTDTKRATNTATATATIVSGTTSLPGSGVIGATTITPSSIALNAATEVTITVAISDPSVIPGSVNLQRLDPIARVFNVLSVMYDDGTHGDAVAGDGIYTIRLSFNESSPFPVVLRVSAAFKGSLLQTFSNPFNLGVTGLPPTAITIASPGNLAFVNASPISVSGTVSDPSATVTVNGVKAVASGGRFSVSVPLLEGPNTITAVTVNSQGTSSTASVQVTLDTTPPRVSIDSPFNGFVTADSTVIVTGKVNDIVVGTVNSQQATVTVNGAPAQVSNRSFVASSVVLILGNNTLTATAVDRAGNSATSSITVTRVSPSQPRITVVSGNNQTGAVNTALAQPLVVQVLDGAGTPIPSQTVVFAVTQNNGLLNGSTTPQSVLTDKNGKAQVTWTLGSRSGSVNLVEASVAGIPGSALFTATGFAGQPAKIVVDAGGQQTGATGQPLPNPLAVIVTDAAHNRLANIPVTFQVTKGGGNFGGQTNTVINTDSDGRAMAVLTLGPSDGIANNLVQANFAGNTGFPSAFSLSGQTPGEPAATTIKGVVLDNSNQPVPGATIRVYLENVPAQVSSGLPPSATATSDVQGQFSIEPAPVGFVKLLVDGSTIQRPGKWPNLEYELVTVAGQVNTLGMPVYLLPIDTAHQLCVSDTVGGILTLPQIPGFALTVMPGAATFPGGSKSGCISVTPVHPDKIPMVPGFGQQPRFIVTIQPAGTTFNPPAQIAIPNSDGLKPREITEMYGFDHDLGMFVSIGTGTASADGTVITSDRGVGVVKAGWFCGGPPADAGGAGHCPECKMCNGTDCIPDPASDFKPCRSGKGCCLNGSCEILPTAIPAGVKEVKFEPTPISPSPCKKGDSIDSTFGETCPKDTNIDITAYFSPSTNTWKAKVTTAELHGTIWYRILPWQTTFGNTIKEASLAAATNKATACKMIHDLDSLGTGVIEAMQWFSTNASAAHENAHVTEIRGFLNDAFPALKASIEGLSVPHDCKLTPDAASAKNIITSLPAYIDAVGQFGIDWRQLYDTTPDPDAATDQAMHAVIDPLVQSIEDKWGACQP